jgi:phage repressor protein C with HTH and peptisase S24 domain
METLGQRLKTLRGPDSQAAAAKRSGISQQQWSKLERDLIDADDSSVLGRIADAYGVTTDELRGSRPLKPRTPETVRVGQGDHDSPLVYVTKVTGAHLSAGSGEVLWDMDELQNSHAFQADYMREKGLRPERCKIWTVRGDSMEPRYRSGGVVLIDMSDRAPVHSKVFALVGEDGLRIKQLRRGIAGWEMHSYNPDQNKYPPEPIVGENYAIIGRVRWYAGDED